MKSMLKKILLLVAVGVVAFACKDVKPEPKPKPEPEPSVFKIAINVAGGEQYTSQIDSVEAYYSTKEFNTVVLRRVPYNHGILHHPSIYGRGSRPLFRQILLLR